MPAVSLNMGNIHYEKVGPDHGQPVVLIHGYAMGGSLWRPLTERLAANGFRCIAPTWPLGAHTEAMDKDAELTIEAIAAMVGELLDELSLEGVVLVGNDTGGAIAQVVATTMPERLGALVLTSCDAFEHFPPPILKPFIAAAKFAPTFQAALQPLRTKLGRERAYGALAHADIDALVTEWTAPALTDSKVRNDLRRLTASLDQRTTLQAAERLPQFDKPAMVAWSQDDAFFPLEDGRRLAAKLPDARLEVIGDARTFSMIDQPDSLAGLIGSFADGRESRRAA
ncbi:MAG TPA: alpha/beta hydrolase [Solirubrobacteraceae bacterium]|nr:alpha/beta hydrolase [Solirubrobacteraceae bacterium]